MAEEVTRTLDELFREFLKLRVSNDWPDEQAKLTTWINRAAEK